MMRATAPSLDKIVRTRVGGASVARLNLEETAQLMIALAKLPARSRPLYLTSVNGEVLARCAGDPSFAAMVESADLISADGQALVIASKLLSKNALPERVATTDLYWVAARQAEAQGASFYLLGATEEVNARARQATTSAFPRLDIRGASHGYLTGAALENKLDEINQLAPDILWLALGVPREQAFVRQYGSRLSKVKMIKTSGGLFDFVAGARSRAPLWMQKTGFEWAYRLSLEPKRLLIRYLTTNPTALILLLTRTS